MNTRHHEIDLKKWERSATYLGFKNFDFPYLIVGCDLQITEALAYWKSQKRSPYLCMIYAVCRAANSIPAFRQRLRGDSVIEYETVHANFTEPKGDSSFTVRLQAFQDDFLAFYQSLEDPNTLAEVAPGDSVHMDDYWIFMSCLPWVRFNHVVQPTTRQNGSVPRIIWGKFTTLNSEVIVPLSVQVHHSLVDGVHVAQFFQSLETILLNPAKNFS